MKMIVNKILMVLLVCLVGMCVISCNKKEENLASKDIQAEQDIKKGDEKLITSNDVKEVDTKTMLRTSYGENKEILDDNYEKALAVTCINGTFVGKKKDKTIVYRGIPFVGEQPVGKNRWKRPVPYVKNDGVYEAFYNAKSALQREDESEGASLYYQGEDCLYLNIWKSDDDIKNKPVMVWIHGGAFENGGTIEPLHDCHNFIEENPDVIMITIAYRLGVFGFFHLSHLSDGAEYVDSQNLGLLDQAMALKWINENIVNFGGDPTNVTIFGESAGAASVTLLPLMKETKGYFNKVIAQSGSPVFTRSTEQSIECTNEVLKKLNCKSISDLQNVPIDKIIEASAVLRLRCWAERDGRILPEHPYEAYERGECKDITFLQGCNKDEVCYFVAGFGGPENFEPWGIDRKTKKYAQLNEEERKLVDEYFNSLDGENYDNIRKLFDQIVFRAPLIRLAENQINGGGKSYVYYFTVESTIPYVYSGHSVELAGLFNLAEITQCTGRAFDLNFSKTMRKMWVNFAKNSDPSLSAIESPDGKEKIWVPYEIDDKNIMVFDEFNIHMDKEENLNIVDRVKTYFLTKYYCI